MSEDVNICEPEESDLDEEDTISASDHGTNTTVDDSDADPNVVPCEYDLTEESQEVRVDNVDMVQNKTAVPIVGNRIDLNTIDETIEACGQTWCAKWKHSIYSGFGWRDSG